MIKTNLLIMFVCFMVGGYVGYILYEKYHERIDKFLEKWQKKPKLPTKNTEKD